MQSDFYWEKCNEEREKKLAETKLIVAALDKKPCVIYKDNDRTKELEKEMFEMKMAYEKQIADLKKKAQSNKDNEAEEAKKNKAKANRYKREIKQLKEEIAYREKWLEKYENRG